LWSCSLCNWAHNCIEGIFLCVPEICRFFTNGVSIGLYIWPKCLIVFVSVCLLEWTSDLWSYFVLYGCFMNCTSRHWYFGRMSLKCKCWLALEMKVASWQHTINSSLGLKPLSLLLFCFQQRRTVISMDHDLLKKNIFSNKTTCQTLTWFFLSPISVTFSKHLECKK
jgi:hypothetical protein